MYIKEVTERTGATRKAIYLYESMSLLPGVERDVNMYRTYTGHHVKLVNLIRRAQELGFKLSELVPLIEEKRVTQQFPTGLAIKQIKLKRASIKSEIAMLSDQYRGLGELMQEVSKADF